MKRLCVFYNKSNPYLMANTEWIVCKACAKKLRKCWRVALLEKAAHELKTNVR